MTDAQAERVAFRIRQGNMTVAKTDGPNAEALIWEYAAQYRRSGELTIQHNAEGHWKRYALLCQWPPRAALKGADE